MPKDALASPLHDKTSLAIISFRVPYVNFTGLVLPEWEQ